MLKNFICLIILLTAANIANANVDEEGKITRIIIEGNIASIWLDGADVLTDCAAGSRWTVRGDDGLFREKLSALLSAAAAGNTVKLRHLTSNGCGGWDSNKIYYVQVIY